ncbi:hypothetical protein B0J14DRAFT_604718 [Halenospora varia]|nr:hypothetical protein B0J14DRAFT_604718 [Halenospora varia]
MSLLTESAKNKKNFDGRMKSMWSKVNGLNKELGANVFLYITGPYGTHYYKSDPNFPEGFNIREGIGKGPEDFMTPAELRVFLQKQEAAAVNPPAMPPGFEYLNEYNLMGDSHTSAPNQVEAQAPGRLPSLSFMAPLSPFSRPSFETPQPQPLDYNTRPSQTALWQVGTGLSSSSSGLGQPPLVPRRLSTPPASQAMETQPSRSSPVQAAPSTPPQMQLSRSSPTLPTSIPSTPPHTQLSPPSPSLPRCSPPPYAVPSPLTPPDSSPSRRSRLSAHSSSSSRKLRSTPRSRQAKNPSRFTPPPARLRTPATAASPLSPLLSDTDSEHGHLDDDDSESDSDSSDGNSASEYLESSSPTSSPPVLPSSFRLRSAISRKAAKVTKKRPASPLTGAVREPKLSKYHSRNQKKA